jgi:DNA-directed RNA polymerase alpha subunit
MKTSYRTAPGIAIPESIGKPAFRALQAEGFLTLHDVSRVSEAALLELHGVGPKAVRILKASLEQQGLSFADDGDEDDE